MHLFVLSFPLQLLDNWSWPVGLFSQNFMIFSTLDQISMNASKEYLKQHKKGVGDQWEAYMDKIRRKFWTFISFKKLKLQKFKWNTDHEEFP